MGRRANKGEGALIALLIFVGLPVYFIAKILEVTGWVLPVAVVVCIIVTALWSRHAKQQRWLAYLRSKYLDETLVQRIANGYFWQGQTEEQLRDSLGSPTAVDHKLLKTMRREVWKYHESGRNRYRLRITVENGIVSTWDQKS